MTAYFLVAILLVGIPFLLYCLWNFGRELRPRKSRFVMSSSFRTTNRPESISAFRAQRPIIYLQEGGRSTS
jgi:hypothetical protein